MQRTERRRFNFPCAADLIVSRVQPQKIVFSGGENINRRAARGVLAVPPEGKLSPLYGGVEEVSGDGLGIFKNARLRRAERNVFRAPFGSIGRVKKLIKMVNRFMYIPVTMTSAFWERISMSLPMRKKPRTL